MGKMTTVQWIKAIIQLIEDLMESPIWDIIVEHL
jgi:hypothetical protein